MNAALHAHLGRTEQPRFLGTIADLVERERVRVGVRAALRERAEPAAGVADVGEVDVPVHDVGDVVAGRARAQIVGERAQRVEFGAVAVQQRQRVLVGQPGRIALGRAQRSSDIAVDALHRARAHCLGAHRVPVAVDAVEVLTTVGRATLRVDRGVQIGAPARHPRVLGFLPRNPLQHSVFARETGIGVGERGDVRQHPRVEPRLADLHVVRVDREPLDEPEAALVRAASKLFDLRPRTLGVDVIRRERRDAAPVVDAGAQQQRELVADQVRRRLDPHPRAEHQPRHGDGRGEVVQVGVRHARHRGVRLRAEVLHDDFLNPVVCTGDSANREQRVDPLGERLADADQDAGGERDGRAAGVLEHAQPNIRILVGRTEVRTVRVFEQPPRGRLEHHPHRRGDRLEPLQFGPRHHAGVQVRQQTGALEHEDRHRAHVGERRVVAVRVEPFARRRPAVLRTVTEREQCFLAAERRALRRDREHLVRRQERCVHSIGCRRERAVVTAVATQPRERDEHLARIGDDAGTSGIGQALIAHARRGRKQIVKILAARAEQDFGLGLIERDAVACPAQRTPQCGRAHTVYKFRSRGRISLPYNLRNFSWSGPGAWKTRWVKPRSR